MSLTEIKAEIGRMSDADLEELAVCVRLARKARDPGWLERVTQINATMDAGHEHGEEELLRVHEDATGEGR